MKRDADVQDCRTQSNFFHAPFRRRLLLLSLRRCSRIIALPSSVSLALPRAVALRVASASVAEDKREVCAFSGAE